jgi:hypothetical protein
LKKTAPRFNIFNSGSEHAGMNPENGNFPCR